MGEDMPAGGEPGNLVARVRTHRQAVHAFIDAVAAERARPWMSVWHLPSSPIYAWRCLQ